MGPSSYTIYLYLIFLSFNIYGIGLFDIAVPKGPGFQHGFDALIGILGVSGPAYIAKTC